MTTDQGAAVTENAPDERFDRFTVTKTRTTPKKVLFPEPLAQRPMLACFWDELEGDVEGEIEFDIRMLCEPDGSACTGFTIAAAKPLPRDVDVQWMIHEPPTTEDQ